jgi:hypothetical protein
MINAPGMMNPNGSMNSGGGTALVTTNAFNAQVAATGVNPAAVAAAAHAKAIVEARYVVAINRPRDWDVVREKLLKECKRPRFAAAARYKKPIGQDENKWPTGPSIRFAEAAVRAMTNLTVDTTTTYDDEQRRVVHVEVADLESNVPYALDVPIAKTIERRKTKEGDVVLGTRTNSYGDKLYILLGTDDDIQNKQAAAVSKAMRTLALRLLPGDILDECMDECIETLANEDARDPNAARRQLFDAFAGIGVRAEQLKDYLGSDGATLTPAQLADLRALYAAIKDGEATWREVMDARKPEGAATSAGAPKKKGVTLEDIKARSVAKREQRKAAQQQAAASAQQDEAQGSDTADQAAASQFESHQAQAQASKAMTYAHLADAMNKAPDRDAADQVLDRGRDLPDEQREDLARLYESRFPD